MSGIVFAAGGMGRAMRVRQVVGGAIGLVVGMSATLLPAGPAHASYIASAFPTMPSPVAAGPSPASGALSLANFNTPPDHAASIPVTEIRMVPSCGVAPGGSVCTQPDAGVFSIGSSASGRNGSTCDGLSFTVSAPDPSGHVVITPATGLSLPPQAGGSTMSCVIDFTFTTLKSPTIDASASPGIQTSTNLQVTYQTPFGSGIASGSALVTVTLPARDAPADFDADSDTDVSVFRPSEGAWHVNGQPTAFHGLPGDLPVPAAYTVTGRDDRAVFRPSVGGWYAAGREPVFFGLNGDIPVPGDYNADGLDSVAVFRPSVGGWYVQGMTTRYLGLAGDIPVVGDWNGDGRDDIGVYRPSVGGWYRETQAPVFFGLDGDVPVVGDWDGDGRDDIAVYRPSVGGWYVQDQAARFLGLAGDIPVPGNYDASAADEIAVFRRTTGAWFLQGGASIFWGGTGDIPSPLPYSVYQAFTFPGG